MLHSLGRVLLCLFLIGSLTSLASAAPPTQIQMGSYCGTVQIHEKDGGNYPFELCFKFWPSTKPGVIMSSYNDIIDGQIHVDPFVLHGEFYDIYNEAMTELMGYGHCHPEADSLVCQEFYFPNFDNFSGASEEVVIKKDQILVDGAGKARSRDVVYSWEGTLNFKPTAQ